MGFLPSLSPDDLDLYHRAVLRSVAIRSHFDVFVWLQGDMQRFIPHEILIAAWGNFHDDGGVVHHDIVSALPGVRSQSPDQQTLTPLLLQLFHRWTAFGCTPFSIHAGESSSLLQDTGLGCTVGKALQTMRSVLVHGINDERGRHDCIYVAFSSQPVFSDHARGAMAVVLPYLDVALRQIKHLPHQSHSPVIVPVQPLNNATPPQGGRPDISEREAEVLQWVALGKTNADIGSILSISEFTVKNHLQRVFKKLNVSNRAQAISKYRVLIDHV